mgnify:CR=1 FL=1
MKKEAPSKRRRAVKPKKLRTSANYDFRDDENQHIIDYGPSKTVPDQNLTVKNLMERHTRGIGTGVTEREPIYLPDHLEVKRPQDLTEILEYKEELEQEAKRIQKIVDKELAEQEKQKQEAEASEQAAKEAKKSEETSAKAE